MAEEGPDRTPLLLLAGAIGLSALVAGRVLLRSPARSVPSPGKTAPPRRMARLWPDDTSPPEQVPETASQPQQSSLELVTRPAEAARSQDGAAPPAAAGGAQDPAAAAANDAWKSAQSGAAGISQAEKDQLARLAGRDLTDPRKAADVATADGPWSSLIRALSHYPRLMAYIVNSDVVVKAFMSRQTSERYCQSSAAYKAYLMDTKNPSGVSHAMDIVGTVIHGDPRMPTVIFSSKLADAMLDCPSVQALSHDRQSIGDIAIANPRALQMTTDPAIMAGLAANPTAMASFQSVESNLGR